MLRQIEADSQDFRYLVVKAKTELAFSYTRLGPPFIPDAITLFSEVIPEAKEPEKWLWKFGLALTRRRKLRASSELSLSKPETGTVEEAWSLLQLFQEVEHHCISENLKAKAYAEIAALLHMLWTTSLRTEFITQVGMTPKDACERALQLDSNDHSVLRKCSRIFRYLREIEKSLKLLEKAVCIRPSSTAFYHLALTYKSFATSEIYRNIVKAPLHYSLSALTYTKFATSEVYENIVKVPGRYRQLEKTYRVSSSTYSKSPPRAVTRFSRNDRYVPEALRNFRKAVEFSEGENTPALYDLALMHKSLGELAKAKENLEAIVMNQRQVSGFYQIDVYEQLGLIMREMAHSATKEENPPRLLQDGRSMLLMSLKLACRHFTRSAGFTAHRKAFICFRSSTGSAEICPQHWET